MYLRLKIGYNRDLFDVQESKPCYRLNLMMLCLAEYFTLVSMRNTTGIYWICETLHIRPLNRDDGSGTRRETLNPHFTPITRASFAVENTSFSYPRAGFAPCALVYTLSCHNVQSSEEDGHVPVCRPARLKSGKRDHLQRACQVRQLKGSRQRRDRSDQEED